MRARFHSIVDGLSLVCPARPTGALQYTQMKALNILVINKQGSGCWCLPLAVVRHEPWGLDATLAKGKKALATISAKKPSRKRKAKAKDTSD